MILAVTGDAVIAASATVSVALIGLIGVLLQFRKDQKRLLRENEEQHVANDSNAALRHIEAMKAIERIDVRLDDHITWHAHVVPPVTIVHPVLDKKEVA